MLRSVLGELARARPGTLGISLGSIVHGVTNVVKDTASFFTGGTAALLAANGKPIGPGLALDAAGLAAGTGLAGILGSLGSGIGSTLGAAESALASNTTSIFGSIASVLDDVKSAIGPLVSSVAGTVHDIASTVKDINEGVIKPIVGPINEAIDTFKALRKVIDEDVRGGIKGILRIPDDLEKGLGSIDATIQRSLMMLGASHADTLRTVLLPALVGADGKTLGDLNATFHSVLAPTAGAWTPPPVFAVTDSPDVEAYKASIRADQEEIARGQGIAAEIVRWVLKSVASLEAIAIQREPYNDLWREELNRAFGIKKFDAGTVQELFKRGEVDRNEAKEELQSQGYNASRAEAIISAARALPDTSRALQLYARRWIDDKSASEMLAAQGWVPDDVQLLLNSSYSELDFGQLVELVRRGQLKPEEAQATLERQGFRQDDAFKALSLVTQLLGVQDIISLADRSAITNPGLGFRSLAEGAPSAVRSYAAQLGISEPQADVLWANHWRLLTPELAVLAYFRSFINSDQLDQALASASIPPELRQTFIDLQRPRVPVRSVGTLVTHGVITASDAVADLTSRGFSLVDAQRIVDLSTKANAPSVKPQADHVHGLNVSVILDLYDAETVSNDEATELLIGLGWTNEAIASTLLLHDVRRASQERQAQTALVISQARANLLSYEDAQARLGQLGLTTPELNKALAQLTTQLNQHTKLPGETQVIAMYKRGVIDRQTALDTLRLLGYGPTWAERLIELEEASATKPSKQA